MSKSFYANLRKIICFCILIPFGEGNGTPLQYSCLENPMGRVAWWAAVHGVSKRQDMTEWLQFHCSLSCIGEGNGSPLQCSCLENPRDRGAWWAESMGLQRVGPNWRDLAAAAVPIPFSFKEGLWLASRTAGYISQNRCSKSGFIILQQSSGWLIFEAWWATQLDTTEVT